LYIQPRTKKRLAKQKKEKSQTPTPPLTSTPTQAAPDEVATEKQSQPERVLHFKTCLRRERFADAVRKKKSEQARDNERERRPATRATKEPSACERDSVQTVQ